MVSCRDCPPVVHGMTKAPDPVAIGAGAVWPMQAFGRPWARCGRVLDLPFVFGGAPASARGGRPSTSSSWSMAGGRWRGFPSWRGGSWSCCIGWGRKPSLVAAAIPISAPGETRGILGALRSTRRCAPHASGRSGLTMSIPQKWRSLAVATTHPFAAAVAAMIMSSPLRGRPARVPSAISWVHASAARSSNGRIRPANSGCGPSGPANQASRARRFRQAGCSRMALRISATVRLAMNRSWSGRAASHASNGSGGRGLATALMMLVSSR